MRARTQKHKTKSSIARWTHPAKKIYHMEGNEICNVSATPTMVKAVTSKTWKTKHTTIATRESVSGPSRKKAYIKMYTYAAKGRRKAGK